jgi:hypothetical protein
MNTLCDNPAQSMIPIVEAFLYQDTVGVGTASELRAASSGEASEEKAATADKIARVRDEEMSSIIAKAAAEGLAQGERQAVARLEKDLEQERKRVADTILEFQRQRTQKLRLSWFTWRWRSLPRSCIVNRKLTGWWSPDW